MRHLVIPRHHLPAGVRVTFLLYDINKIKNKKGVKLAQSTLTVASLMGVTDPSIKIIKTIDRPFIKQFATLSKSSTTEIKPALYNVKVELDTPKFTPQSKVKVSCDCLDFRYRYAYCFNEKGALLTVPSYVMEPPTKTNSGCSKIKACKHIKVALKYGLQRQL